MRKAHNALFKKENLNRAFSSCRRFDSVSGTRKIKASRVFREAFFRSGSDYK
jgi:hypothetical protein